MPQLGESIVEGKIVRWNKNVGDRVDRDEPLFEVSTDKVDAEIPSPVGGVVTEVRVGVGETVDVDSIVRGYWKLKMSSNATNPESSDPPPSVQNIATEENKNLTSNETKTAVFSPLCTETCRRTWRQSKCRDGDRTWWTCNKNRCFTSCGGSRTASDEQSSSRFTHRAIVPDASEYCGAYGAQSSNFSACPHGV